ncbi:MAG: NADH-quinone oxidoreductase subunit NuoK [Gammaproteobacteria bacterium]|nr:NADH-quinone oxidoreductase subunit NuoK [Gammaproteobacteria bacterium]
MTTAISIPLEHVFFLAIILFLIGAFGVLVRRNIIFMLLSLEIMMNACGLAFVAAGARWAEPDGQIMFMFILALAAAEVAVALGLVVQLARRFETLDIDRAEELNG